MADQAFVIYRMVVQAAGGDAAAWCRCGTSPTTSRRWPRRSRRATRLVFLANPNNPTGTIFQRDAVGGLPRRALPPHGSSSWPTTPTPTTSRIRTIPTRSPHAATALPIVTLRTFSKIYGLAGLRVGYGVAPAGGRSRCCNRIRQPFNVNALAQVAALAALDDDEHVERTRARSTARAWRTCATASTGSASRTCRAGRTSSWCGSATGARLRRAAAPRRDRAADGRLRLPRAPARHGRHAGGEPALRRGAARRSCAERRVTPRLRAAGDRRRRPDRRLARAGGARAPGWSARWSASAAARRTWQVARARGIVDRDARAIRRDAGRGVDLVVLAVPVRQPAPRSRARCVPHAARRARSSPTSAASRRRVVAALEARWPRPGRSCGGHPIAGSERAGRRRGDAADLFRGARCILTPTARDRRRRRWRRVRALWEGVGARVEEHGRRRRTTRCSRG